MLKSKAHKAGIQSFSLGFRVARQAIKGFSVRTKLWSVFGGHAKTKGQA